VAGIAIVWHYGGGGGGGGGRHIVVVVVQRLRIKANKKNRNRKKNPCREGLAVVVAGIAVVWCYGSGGSRSSSLVVVVAVPGTPRTVVFV
jgi:hypothetical protein